MRVVSLVPSITEALASVRREAAVLEGMVVRDFQDIGERTSALTGDRQGIGGASKAPGLEYDEPRA